MAATACATASDQIGPGGAVQTARGVSPAPQAGQEGGTGGIDAPGVQAPARVRGGDGDRKRLLLLGPGMPRRDGEAQDVGQGARVAVGDRPAQGQDGRREDRLRRDDPAQRGEPAGVVAGGDAVEHVAVDVLAGEPHPHADTRRHLRVEVRRDGVVERAVEVRRLDVDRDAGHGQRAGDAGGWSGTAAARRGPEQLELLRRRFRRAQPTTDRRASTRSVRSQVKSASSRPKCPYADVCE